MQQSMDVEILARHLKEVLDMLDIDWRDPNYVDTPVRWAKWLLEYRCQPVTLSEILTPTFDEDHHELVVVKKISFTALCAHHMLPFRGVAHVGYLPNGRVVGLSKIVRAVKRVAICGPTLQERMADQLVDEMMTALEPMGVMCVIEAEHQCMTIRGVRDPEARTITSSRRGYFEDNVGGCKDEFLALIGGGK